MTLTEELSIMPETANRTAAANHLQSDWGGCSVSFIGWPGTTAAVAKDKKQIMADAVGAKKIGASVPKFDTKHPTYKALTRIKGQIRDHWEAFTLDWVEDGVRLIRQDRVAAFNEKLAPLAAELDAARDAIAECYPTLVEDAQQDNGDLFDRSVYLQDFEGAYTFKVDYPTLTAPPSSIITTGGSPLPGRQAPCRAGISSRYPRNESTAFPAMRGRFSTIRIWKSSRRISSMTLKEKKRGRMITRLLCASILVVGSLTLTLWSLSTSHPETGLALCLALFALGVTW